MCGVIGDAPSVWDPIDLGQIERLAASALEEPDRHSASKLLTQMLPETTGPLPGVRNSGMLSTHQLGEGVRTRVGLGAISPRVEMAEDAVRIYSPDLLHTINKRFQDSRPAPSLLGR